MISIKELKNPDIIEVNGEKFQVINNTSLWYHIDKQELEMVVELVKVGQEQMTPNFRLTYIYERPEDMKFFVFNKTSKEFKEQTLKSVKFKSPSRSGWTIIRSESHS